MSETASGIDVYLGSGCLSKLLSNNINACKSQISQESCHVTCTCPYWNDIQAHHICAASAVSFVWSEILRKKLPVIFFGQCHLLLDTKGDKERCKKLIGISRWRAELSPAIRIRTRNRDGIFVSPRIYIFMFSAFSCFIHLEQPSHSMDGKGRNCERNLQTVRRFLIFS